MPEEVLISRGARVARPARTLWQEIWLHRRDYLFISPFFILFAIFSAFPLGWAFVISFSNWRGFGPMNWVGLDNWRAMFNDIYIGKALLNSVIFTVVLVPTGVSLALVFAVLLNVRDLRGRGIFRTIYFLPYITATVIIAIVFDQLLDDTYGWVNRWLEMLNQPAIPWLRGEGWAKASIVILCHWQGVGYNMLIMLGGLQGIQLEIYEAAKIDGANALHIFWSITLPLMRPVMLFIAVLGTIGVMNLFAQPFMLTEGGPSNDTLTLTLRLYQIGIASTRYGDASALGFLAGLIVLIISFVQLRLLRTWRG